MGKKSLVTTSIFMVTMLLRLALGLLNGEANDNHVDVVDKIIATHHFPDKNECNSCYQPKLFYVISAIVVRGFNVTEFYARIRVMNLINVFLSIFILILFWKFIDGQGLQDPDKHIVFALFAFNPCLVGINVQSTNDTLVILLGVLTVYLYHSVFTGNKIGRALLLAAVLVAAMLAKASAFVLVGVVGVVFVIRIIAAIEIKDKVQALKGLLVVLVAIITIVPFAGGYYDNYKKYGSSTLSSWEKDEPPHFFEKTFITRAGVRSMADAFLTFRYFDMIAQPYDNNEWNNYPRHRTSLWSQLYGRTAFVHFPQWPYSWQSQDVVIVNIGRVLIILGIVPLALFLVGIFFNSKRFARALINQDRGYFAAPVNHVYLLTTLAFLASSVYYSYTFRDFSAMKSIYIFPGLLAFIKLFIDGYGMLKGQKVILAVRSILILIVIFSIADILFLVKQLY